MIEASGYAVQDLHIAGSLLQNSLNSLARRTGRSLPDPVLPGLLAYELIYTATAQTT